MLIIVCCKMELMDIPTEVIYTYVLPYLKWNDLLRFRRVCKWTNAITNDYLHLHPELAPEIEISAEKGKDFRAFLDMGIPTTKIFLNNTSGDKFYQDGWKDGVIFLEQFGPFVRSLRLDQISYFLSPEELEFLERLRYLQNLEIHRYGGYQKGLSLKKIKKALEKQKSRAKENPLLFPSGVNTKLTSLKIGNNKEVIFKNLFMYNKWFLTAGEALEYISMPFSSCAEGNPDTIFYNNHHGSPMAVGFLELLIKIALRSQQNPPLANYKVINFESFHNIGDHLKQFNLELLGFPFFLALCRACVSEGVKLQNVGASWFMARKHTQEFYTPAIGTQVCSLVNIHPYALSEDMPNLERMEIRSTVRSSPGDNWRNQRPSWPSLKSLEVTVDSSIGGYYESIGEDQNVILRKTSTMELFNLLFENVSRTVMSELRLDFSHKGATLIPPKTEDIVSACPNLRKLAFCSWPGTNKSLVKLWSGLPCLEEVSLEYCKKLGDAAFVGEDARSPVFLKLSKLKKMSLKGLDEMPKITNNLFTQVIRHLKLTHLYLTSNPDFPIKSVTIDGIRSLQDGVFSQSIEKFPFEDWSLEGIPDEEFRTLESTFRSFYMI